MSLDEPDRFSSIEELERTRRFFKDETAILRGILTVITTESGVIWVVCRYMVYVLVQTCESIVLLSEKGYSRDSYILARTLFESIVNVCFICAQGEAAANRAIRHAKQKSYRDLKRELVINERVFTLEWLAHVDIEKDLDLKDALGEFTSKKGREITDWTPETLLEQVKIVDAHYGEEVGVRLQFAFAMIYRHASEYIHGTFFGALHAFGLTDPISPHEDVEAKRRSDLNSLLLMLTTAIIGMTVTISKELPALKGIADLALKIENEYTSSVTWGGKQNKSGEYSSRASMKTNENKRVENLSNSTSEEG
jgi:hypothetical protein